MKMLSSFHSITLGLSSAASLVSSITISQIKSPIIEEGPSFAQFTYPGYGLDAPRVAYVNSTVFDWWYFDMISDDVADGDLSSVVAVFHDGTSGGFQTLAESTNKLPLALAGTFPNGSIWRTYTFQSEAVVIADETHSQGSWGGVGRWSGDSGSGVWEASFDLEAYGVRGTFRLESRAPPHFACGLVEPGASESILPHVGWANAVPDAKATVDFEINGTALSFSGTGYHDKNWADRPFFNDSVLSWYWGHASLGPYSVVWFDALDSEGTEYFSTYVARDGQVLAINCENGTAIVRPWGGEDTYPPPAGSETPNGFIITFADVEGQEFTINVTTFATPVPNPLYNRFIGTAEGSFHGENETFVGVASYEQFKAV